MVSLGFSIIAKTSAQKSAFRDFSGQSAVLGAVTVYTCPAGKIAKCMGTLVVDSYGGATQVRMRGASGSKVINFRSTIPDLVGIVRESGVFILEAGDTCTVTANLGITSDAEWTLSVEELPA